MTHNAESRDQVAARAGDLLRREYHCSEAILLAVGGHVLPALPPLCIRMATPLCGGIGSSHEDACGALTGGVLVIGGLYGRTDPAQNDDQAKALAVAYRDRFLDAFGTTCCGPIRDWVQGDGGPGTCAVIVERAASILLDVLDNQNSSGQASPPL